jgi:hypothetical protein
MQHPTEQLRRQRIAELSLEAGARAELEAPYGQVWNTLEQLKLGNRQRLRNDERRWIKRKDSIGSVGARSQEVENRSRY